MSKVKLFAAGVVAAVSFASAVLAADTSTSGGRVPTVTRLVKLFMEREAALGDAVRAGDLKRTETFLSEDFEMRTGAAAAVPIPRANWLNEMIRTRDPGEAPTAMAVHDLNGTAVVSFTQGGGRNAIFVVDVWRATGNDWRLAIRYAAPAGTGALKIPGASAAPPEIPKKY